MYKPVCQRHAFEKFRQRCVDSTPTVKSVRPGCSFICVLERERLILLTSPTVLSAHITFFVVDATHHEMSAVNSSVIRLIQHGIVNFQTHIFAVDSTRGFTAIIRVTFGHTDPCNHGLVKYIHTTITDQHLPVAILVL